MSLYQKIAKWKSKRPEKAGKFILPPKHDKKKRATALDKLFTDLDPAECMVAFFSIIQTLEKHYPDEEWVPLPPDMAVLKIHDATVRTWMVGGHTYGEFSFEICFLDKENLKWVERSLETGDVYLPDPDGMARKFNIRQKY